MTETLRQSTLETLGYGAVLDVYREGRHPADSAELVERVFGAPDARGALVISGANGIVGSGKAMQLGARLQPYGVPIVALDLPSAPDGIGRHYNGLVSAFGRGQADAIMQGIVRLSYDGRDLPKGLDRLQPRFLLEAIPEILEIKRAHYELFRGRYPDIAIRSVTSGFPSSELGVGIAHPAFPHEINKVWEIVEDEPSDITRLMWSLGLQPLPMGDYWSFVLDVLFCGVTLAALRYGDASNMPYWKIDKYVRKFVGPNPFRAHDAIGAKGADFLTWSCLHHLSEHYGGLFTPNAVLTERKETGENWYPQDHFRPLVDWSLSDEEQAELSTWLFGALFQMTTLMVHEQRASLTTMNSIGELCAQFRRGALALMREAGADTVRAEVEAYHRLYPDAAATDWHPEALEAIETPAWQQLYVNAEHDGTVGVVTLGREAYNADVDAELNRALDWLRAAGIERLIVGGDFHLSTQLVGADTNEFFPALDDEDAGYRISNDWSRTARRFHEQFAVSVGFVNGKRCLGGMLELLIHCHYLVSLDDAALGFPEVTLPVVPGMEGCHWPFRKTGAEGHAHLLKLLLGGRPVTAELAVGWLVDVAAPLDDAIAACWQLATGASKVPRRDFAERGFDVSFEGLESFADDAARQAITACVRAACAAPWSEAVDVQSEHSAGFMASDACRRGRVGSEFARTMKV